MKAPLQLERYFFTKVEVDANLDFELDKESEGENIKIQFDFELGKHKEDATKFQVMIGIRELHSDKRVLPYRVSLQLVGQFSTAKDFQHDDLDKIVVVNGGSMLYSAARELVLTLTGRGPWPAFQLPTVSFYDLVNKKSEGTKATKPAS